MASGAKIGYGTIFQISTDGGSTYNTLAEVISIEPPSDEIEQIDVTNMDSPNRRREFIPGLIVGGDITVTMNFVPGSATDQLINAIQAAAAVVDCKIIWPGATSTWSFEASLRAYNVSAPTDDKMTATVVFQASGDKSVL